MSRIGSDDDRRRFLAKTRRDDCGCLLWIGKERHGGYGEFDLGGRREYAHRASYMLFKGPIPPGKLIRHKCDTPNCVEPECLIPGTELDNSQDCVERGRMTRGEKKGNAVLTEPVARRIKYGGESAIGLSRELKVHVQTVHAIRQGRSWAHI